MIDNNHWVHSSRVRDAVENSVPTFLLQVEPFRTTWMNVLENHNQCVHRAKTDGFQYNRYLKGTVISHGIVHPELNYFNQLGETIKDIYNYESVTCHSYTSFTVESEVYEYHKDNVDVFVVGVQGLTEFIVDGVKYDIIGGNVLFIPNGVMHGATPRSPRSILSIGLSSGVQNT